MDTAILFILILVILFVLCRELLCWYWKINESIKNQKEIIRLLRKLAEEDENAPIQEEKKNKGFDFINPMKPKVYNS